MALKMHILLFCLLSLSTTVQCGKVLVLCPVSSPSHKNTITPVFTGLAERGHKVTVVSSLKTEPHKNIRDVIPFENFDYFPNLSAMELRQAGLLGMVMFDYNFTLGFCDSVYRHEEFMSLLNEKFDLVLMDGSFNECLLGFVYKLGAPLVIVYPMPVLSPVAAQLGNRFLPSFVPEMLLTLSQHMNLFERTLNTVVNYLTYWGVRRPFPIHERIYRSHLGEDLPSVDEILSNASLILSNSHFSFNFPRPTLPDVVEIGGSHCRPGRTLQKDLKEFIGGATDGLILFSLGSIVKPHEMPEETRKAFVKVFSKLKQRVLWKWSKDMPDLPKNVKLSKWIPQQDVLAHRNTRLFITHGGLLSTQEAIYHGIPIVAVPIFGDQDFNANRAADAGIGLMLEIVDATEEIIGKTIAEVLDNKSYREKVKLMSTYFHDQPQPPKERGVFWAEYVMRHKGARHMRSAAREINFFQYYCLDVLAVISTTIIVFFIMLFYAIRGLCKKLQLVSSGKTHGKKKEQ